MSAILGFVKSLYRPLANRVGRVTQRLVHGNGRVEIFLERQRAKSHTISLEKRIVCGGTHIHAWIQHPDGSYFDCGVSHNLLTNIGRDWMSGLHGGFPGAGNTVAADVSTGVTSTSITATGTPWTASNLASPQLGLAGKQVWAAPHTVTNPVVYGNIVSNTTSVITIDKWWKIDDTTGTTPTNTDAFSVSIGNGPARFMGLTADTGAASAADTALASEQTSNGLARVLATYAHTMGASTFTWSNTFSVSGSVTVHKMGMFSCLPASPAGPLIYETVLNADAVVISGDSLTCTDTCTPSGT